MTQYIFFLGRLAEISIAELSNKLPQETEFLSLQNDKLLIELPKELDSPQEFLDELGGTTKIVKIHQSAAYKDLAKSVSALALEKFQGREDKIRFAVSMESIKGGSEKMIKNCLLETKKNLKSNGLSCRFINNNFQNPPTALLLGENIVKKGAEFSIIETGSEYLIGLTVAVQNINKYSRRDFERPERDPHLGMLPPKLAQILINLSGVAKPGNTIYDPFCGIGTILMEGLLMKLNVIGSDVNKENIDKCHKNLKWLKDEQSFESSMRLFNKDATKITKSELSEKISAVISETFLGPPVSHTPAQSKIEENQIMVENLISKFLQTLHPLIPKNTPIVLTLLTYRDGRDYITMRNLHRNFEEIGYEEQSLISHELAENLHLGQKFGKSLIYERPEQIVCREIVKLTAI